MRITELDSTVLPLRDPVMAARAVTAKERVFATASPAPQPHLTSANAALPPGGTLARGAVRNATVSALLGMLAGLARSGV